MASTGLAAVYGLEVKKDSLRLHDQPLIKTYAECCELYDALLKQYLPAPFASAGMLLGELLRSSIAKRADRVRSERS